MHEGWIADYASLTRPTALTRKAKRKLPLMVIPAEAVDVGDNAKLSIQQLDVVSPV